MPNKTIVALLFPVMCAAAIGFLLSAYVHVGSYAGLPIPPLFMSLHMGIFIVWLPTVLVSNQMVDGARRKDFWRIALRGAPVWMQNGFYILFGYAILNFIASFVVGLNIMRTFSGHWMFFYGSAFAVLYSARHTEVWQRRCPLGHKVAADARYCEKCGSPLAD